MDFGRFRVRPDDSRRLGFKFLLTIVAIYRLTLLGRGALAFVDETWYFKSVMTLQALGAGHLRAALYQVATTVARPGAVLARLPIAALQALPLAFGVAASNPRSLLIVQCFNVGVSLAILAFFFDICLVLCGDATSALIAAAVYALLANTNLYVRHLLPYDLALCLGMAALWLGVCRPLTIRRALGAGLLAGGMITIYPGYYLLGPVLCVGIAGQSWRTGWRPALRLAVVFTAGFAVVIAATELLCRAGGVSYILSARELSREITTGGAFDEGWTFLPEYLIRVEHLPGIVLLIGAFVSVCRTAASFRRGRVRSVDWLFLPAIACWAWQSANSAEWHRMVIYGRLIHPWMLFLALMLADAMAGITRPALRVSVFAVVISGTLVSFASWSYSFYRLAYPSDVLYALGIDTALLPDDRMKCELQDGVYYSATASPGPLNRTTRAPYSRDANFLLVNFCQPIGIVGPPDLPSPDTVSRGASLLFDGPHWATFPAYGYEGAPPDARAALIKNGYRVRAYRLQAPASP